MLKNQKKCAESKSINKFLKPISGQFMIIFIIDCPHLLGLLDKLMRMVAGDTILLSLQRGIVDFDPSKGIKIMGQKPKGL